jgi:steroid 5-alpha reductase family enzyme
MFSSERYLYARGLRIGGFLVYRVIKTGKDARFDEFRSSLFKFMRFWLLQALTAWVLLIPLYFAFRSETTMTTPALSAMVCSSFCVIA